MTGPSGGKTWTVQLNHIEGGIAVRGQHQDLCEKAGLLSVRELFRVKIVEEHSLTCERTWEQTVWTWDEPHECICIPIIVQIVDWRMTVEARPENGAEL